MLNLKTDWAHAGGRERLKTRKPQPLPAPRAFSACAMENAKKPVNLVWESVRFGKIRRMYYYCKKSYIYNTAYRAVVGKMSYLVKFGLKIPNADPHKWQEHYSHIRRMVEDAEGESGHRPGFGYRNSFGTLEVTAHVSEYFFNAWNAVHSQDVARDIQSHESAGALSHQGFDHPYTENTIHLQWNGCQDGTYEHGHPHGAHHHHGHHEQERHEHGYHHSHSHHWHEGNAGHSHSSHDSFGSWFFQSFWHMAGMNPYAVCVANHKAHEIHVKPGNTGHSLGIHNHPLHHWAWHGQHAGDRPHQPHCHYGNRGAHETPGPGHAAQALSPNPGSWHAIRLDSVSAAPFSEVMPPAPGNGSLAALPFFEAFAAGNFTNPARRLSKHDRWAHKRAYHISLATKAKFVSRMVVGAEALPE